MYLLKDMLGRFYTSAGLVRISEADRTNLVKKVITNKLGRKQTVYVNPNPKQKPERPAGWESPQDRAKRFKAEREPARQKARETWKQAIDGGKVNGNELAEHLQSLTRDEIRGMLKQLNQRVGGLKKDLVNRLIAKAEENTGKISKQLDNKRNSDNNTVVNNNTTGDEKMTPEALKEKLSDYEVKIMPPWANGVVQVQVSHPVNKRNVATIHFNPDGTYVANDTALENFPELFSKTMKAAPKEEKNSLWLHKDKRHAGTAYVAKLTGPNEKYGFQREFIDGESDGTNRGIKFDNLQQGVYEAQGFSKGGRVYYAIDSDGIVKEITKEEAESKIGVTPKKKVSDLAKVASDYRDGKVIEDEALIVDAVRHGYLSNSEAMNRDW